MIVFISKDDNLNKAHIKYIESRLYELATAVNRYKVENGNVPTMSTISESDRAEMEEYISNLIIIVNTLGHKIFEQLRETETNEVTNYYYIRAARGADAKGIQTQEGFVVLKGSKIATSTVPSLSQSLINKRESLIQENKVSNINGELILQEDCLFTSPSLAAAIVMGRSANGLTEWKNEQGVSLKEIE